MVTFVIRMATDNSDIEIQAAGTSSHAWLFSFSDVSELICKQNVSVNALPHTGARIKEATWFD